MSLSGSRPLQRCIEGLCPVLCDLLSLSQLVQEIRQASVHQCRIGRGELQSSRPVVAGGVRRCALAPTHPVGRLSGSLVVADP